MHTTQELMARIRKNDNLYNFSSGRSGHPTAEEVLNLIEVEEKEPQYLRSPRKAVVNVDEQVMTDCESWAADWDISKSRAVEIILKIGLGDLSHAYRVRTQSEEQQEFDLRNDEIVNDVAASLENKE